MLEFIIKRTEGDYFSILAKDFANIVKPANMPAKYIEGWGNSRILVNGEKISFSEEPIGIQVCFETKILTQVEAEKIVKDILLNIEKHTGEKGKIVQISFE